LQGRKFSRPIVGHSTFVPSTKLQYDGDGNIEYLLETPPVKKEPFLKVLLHVIRNFDDDKEELRKQRRTVFTSADWKKHRSTGRYFRELINLPRSGVIRGLVRQGLIVASLSSAVVGYNMMVELKRFPSNNLPLLTIPTLPFTITSSSLGILLVFRTNAAFARWNEARLQWSHISCKTFDVMRQCLAWLVDKETVAKTVRYLVAFARTTKWHLTDRTNPRKLQEELSGILTDEEVYEIVNSKRKPQFVLLCLTKLIARQSLIPNVQSHMDRGLIELGAALENCDKIYTTPIPLAYTRLTARFLLLWLLTFPLTLYNEFSLSKKWLVPVITFVNSIFLLGIDDLGVQIEEPFSILPLSNICYNVQSTAQMVLQTAGIDWFQGAVPPQNIEQMQKVGSSGRSHQGP
jgi:predicted membrane chloride channel (bestrophin family)